MRKPALSLHLEGFAMHLSCCLLSEFFVFFSGSIDWSMVIADAERERAEHWAKFPKVLKDFYIENDDIADMTKLQVERWRY